MSDEGGEGKYTLITENNEIKPSSRGFTGQGTAKYDNGDIYEGDFQDGHRVGNGIYRNHKSGHKYDGEWSNNVK